MAILELPHHRSPLASALAAKPFVLASGSPRRKDLLEQIGIEPEVYPSDVDESLTMEVPAVEKAVCQLANLKAAEVAQHVSSGFILAADTTVVTADEVMGKPRDIADARRMLIKLSGDTHYVVTGVCLMRKPDTVSLTASCRTKVTFCKLHPQEVEAYLRHQEVMDKAGAYGIQEAAGMFIEHLEGSYSNVVGLPLHVVRDLVYRISGQ